MPQPVLGYIEPELAGIEEEIEADETQSGENDDYGDDAEDKPESMIVEPVSYVGER